jgi:hypothetical protein
MSSNPRGRALIINNEVFDHLPDRIGSGRDVESLNSLLQMLGFKV